MKKTILTLDRVFNLLGVGLFYLVMACIVLFFLPGIIYFGVPSLVVVLAGRWWEKRVTWAQG